MSAIGSYPAGNRVLERSIGPRALAVAVVSMLVAWWGPAAGAPNAGDAFVYQLKNGFNNEVVGKFRYEVGQVDANRVTLTVSPDRLSQGDSRTEVLSADGNGLRQPLYSHGELVEYEFAKAYPAYAFPLDPGKRWSERVKANVSGSKQSRSVRVDGRVTGRERVKVPAGEFDAIKIRRSVYAGDGEDFRQETQIYEEEWYAPALNRWVKKVTRSEYMDMSQCTRAGGCDIRGPWDIFELVESGKGK